MGITIVGLGPGDGRFLTREAWQTLSQAGKIVLRTKRHPAVDDLPRTAEIVSFDAVYDAASSFEEVYQRIVDALLAMALEAKSDGPEIVYAVPGHPLVGESTVKAIMERAEASNVPVKLVDGLSFVEPTLSAVGQDAFDGLQLFDGLEIAGYNHPPINSDLPALLGQLYDRLVAGEVKMALMALYPDDHGVMLVHGAGTASQHVERIPLYAIDRSERIGHMTSLFVPPLANAASLASLAETVAYLRGPDGCPWDQEQTSQSLRAGLLEEASEVLQAIDDQDMAALREEIGDLFYHLVMQVQIAAEQEEFRLNEVIGGIIGKLIRRHPHVWGDVEVADSAEVIRNWETIKEHENDKGSRSESTLDSIPVTLPALARAQKIQQRVARIGFDWPDITGVEEKIGEELEEVRSAASADERQMESGDLLFALVNWVRWLDVDAESALRDANRRFERRFRLVEGLARSRDVDLAGMSIDELEALWQEAKAALAADRRPGASNDQLDQEGA
jgi:tetrapyrrole methylase family protein/MazG family protein